jgi:hypothetical protein
MDWYEFRVWDRKDRQMNLCYINLNCNICNTHVQGNNKDDTNYNDYWESMVLHHCEISSYLTKNYIISISVSTTFKVYSLSSKKD